MPPGRYSSDRRMYELAHEKPGRLLFKYSWPALVAMTLNALYAVVDRFYIGHGCGEDAMAGLTLNFPLMMLFGAFGVFVGAGHSAVLSIKLGEGNRTACEKLLGQLVALKLLFFFVLPPLVFFNADTVLMWCGGAKVTPEAFNCAKTYLKIVVFSHVFSHLAFGFSAMMRAEGNAMKSMVAMIVGFGTNMVLDPLMIFGLDMGVAGAAWATNIAMAASFAYALRHYTGGGSLVRLRLGRIRLYADMIVKPCMVGFAPFLQQVFGAFINIALPLSFSKWAASKAAATTQIASLGVFQSVLILVLMPILGTQQGLQPIIGFNWGARNYRRVRDATVFGFWATTALCIAATVVQTVPPFPRLMASIFVASDNPGLLSIAAHDLIVSNCMLWCIGLNITATTFFQSIGRPEVAIALSSLRQGVVMLPIVWLLPYAMDDHEFAIWLSMPVSDVVCCLATLIPVSLYFRFLSKVREKRVNGETP